MVGRETQGVRKATDFMLSDEYACTRVLWASQSSSGPAAAMRGAGQVPLTCFSVPRGPQGEARVLYLPPFVHLHGGPNDSIEVDRHDLEVMGASLDQPLSAQDAGQQTPLRGHYPMPDL